MPKKRKSPGLSAINKALAIALNLDCADPSRTKENLRMFRQTIGDNIQSRKIPSFYDLKEGQGMISVLAEAYNARMTHVATIRNIMLRFWIENKLCYCLTPESLSFIDDVFHVDKMLYSAPQLLERACRIPMYLEFPCNTPYSGAFCGCTVLPKGIAVDTDFYRDLLFVSVIIGGKGGGKLTMAVIPETSVMEMLQTNDVARELEPLYKALLYIGYLLFKMDAMGRAIISYPRQGCEAYEVHPIPFPDWQPEFLEPDGWLRSGFCSSFDYMSPANMKTALHQELCKTVQFSEAIFDFDRPMDERRMHAHHLLYQSVLDWEDCHIVYRYSKRTADLMTNRNLGEVSTKGITSNLLQYMPAPVLAFLLDESEKVILISTCAANTSSGLAVLFVFLSGNKQGANIIPTDKPYMLSITDQEDECCLEVCCALVHLLTILRDNAAKKAFNDHISQGNPETKALVPVEFKSTPPKPRQPSPAGYPQLRTGTPIEAKPLELFRITGKAVRRAPKSETEKYNSWKMVPHIRRRHIHHYWVGHGANRHLEARWVESMKINCKEGANIPTVVREVK